MAILEGDVLAMAPYDARDTEIEKLRAENRALERQVSDAKVEAERAREDANRALSSLRRQLNPLYRALQAVFGELDAAGVHEQAASGYAPMEASAAPATGGIDPRLKAVWDNWKDKLGQGAAKCIDALLLHGEMNTQQLSIATGYHRNTVPQYVSQLNKASLINKNGGKFSLKQL